MFKVIKILFHLGTLFIPLILWWILKAIFTTSYEDKLTKIQGIGKDTAQLIIENYPDEKELRSATAGELLLRYLALEKELPKK